MGWANTEVTSVWHSSSLPATAYSPPDDLIWPFWIRPNAHGVVSVKFCKNSDHPDPRSEGCHPAGAARRRFSLSRPGGAKAIGQVNVPSSTNVPVPRSLKPNAC